MSDPSSSSRSRSIPDSVIAQNIRGELCLGLGQASTSSAVVAVDLGQHKEISESSSGEAKGDEEDDEANEIVTTSGTIVPSATAEGDDRSNNPTATSAGDAEGHDDREAKLAEEDKKRRP